MAYTTKAKIYRNAFQKLKNIEDFLEYEAQLPTEDASFDSSEVLKRLKDQLTPDKVFAPQIPVKTFPDPARIIHSPYIQPLKINTTVGIDH